MIEAIIKRRKFGIRYSKKIRVPQDWSELSDKSVEFLVKTILNDRITDDKRNLLIIKHIFKLSNADVLKLDSGQIYDLLERLKWIQFKGLNDQLFENPIRGVKMTSKAFKNGTCYQFLKASKYYDQFINSFSDHDLDRLVASLSFYKSKAVKSDEDVEQRVKIIKSIDPKIKLYYVFYFSAFKDLIFNAYGHILFSSEDSSNQSKGIDFGWIGCFMTVAETGVFGNLKGVYDSYFIDVISFLVKKKQEFDNSTKPKSSE